MKAIGAVEVDATEGSIAVLTDEPLCFYFFDVAVNRIAKLEVNHAIVYSDYDWSLSTRDEFYA